MLPSMQLEISVQLLNDDELVYSAAGTANMRVVVNRFNLMIPRMTPKDSLFTTFISEFLAEK